MFTGKCQSDTGKGLGKFQAEIITLTECSRKNIKIGDVKERPSSDCEAALLALINASKIMDNRGWAKNDDSNLRCGSRDTKGSRLG